MEKFPLLNTIRSIFTVIAILILLAGFLVSWQFAQEYGEIVDYNSRTGAPERSPNLVAGVVTFFTFATTASMFLLISELVAVVLRMEDHLQHIRINTASLTTSYQVQNTPAGNPNFKSSPLQQPNITQAQKTTSQQLGLDHFPTYQTRNNVTDLYARPSSDGEIVFTFNKSVYLSGVGRSEEGNWLFVESKTTKGETIQGWTQLENLGLSLSDVRHLPILSESVINSTIDATSSTIFKFQVPVYKAHIYQYPQVDSKHLGTATKYNHVSALKANNKGDWIFIETALEPKIQGWVRLAEIGLSFDEVRNLPFDD